MKRTMTFACAALLAWPSVSRADWGFEVEVGRRATDFVGDDLTGKSIDLLEGFAAVPNAPPAKLFVLSTDHRAWGNDVEGDTYSNLEFVAEKMDQMSGDVDASELRMRATIASMRALSDRLYGDDTSKALQGLFEEWNPGLPKNFRTWAPGGDVPNYLVSKYFKQRVEGNEEMGRLIQYFAEVNSAYPYHYAFLPEAGSVWITPKRNGELPTSDRDGRRGMLSVHFTVGIPMDRMFEFMQWLATDAPTRARDRAHFIHLTSALQLATQVGHEAESDLRDLPHALRQVRGTVALAYVQLAAVAQRAHDRRNNLGWSLSKNLTAVLSRVELHEVYESLDEPARAWLLAHADELANRIVKTLSDAGAAPDRSEIVTSAGTTTFDEYMGSAFGVAPGVAQDDVFGGMTVVHVHDRNSIQLVPVELRFFGEYEIDWQRLDELGSVIIKESRCIIQQQC